MKVVIVDDEPKAIQLLKNYVALFSELELVATFRTGTKALEYLQRHPVDLILLDINMPNLSGLSLSRMIGPKSKIIFTTAYSEYAVESYEVKAVDYLLKPIGFERFAQAIARALATADTQTAARVATGASGTVHLKSGSRIYPVQMDSILFLKKDGNYMHYHTGQGKIMVRETTAEALSRLPAHFMQVHKSYIINKRKITYYDTRQVVLDEQRIPIGPQYRDAFAGAMKGD